VTNQPFGGWRRNLRLAGARRAILLLVLPLAACWEGDNFYAIAETRPALPAGTYRFVPPGNSAPETLKVSILPNGMTSLVDDKQSGSIAGFAPLGGSYFVMWLQDAERSHDTPYMLFQSENGHYRVILPVCTETRDIAVAAGAQVITDPKITTCRFATRAQLEDGLRRLESRNLEAAELIAMSRGAATPMRPDPRRRP
jgi:hypothetical protein